jgi:flagellar assembly protein FliH
MSKPFSADPDQVKHYVLPEVTGDIVGFDGKSVRPQTVEDIEALQKQAYEEGRKQGYQAGLVEIQQEAKKLAGMFNFFHQPLTTLDEDVEQQLTELALTVARLVLKKECTTDPTTVQAIIHEALEFLPVSARNVRVRLNPKDIALLEQGGLDLAAQEWRSIADNTVSQGGCLVESDTSHIDASLETRLQQVVDQLTEHRPRYDDES